jgi:hypothetical protein
LTKAVKINKAVNSLILKRRKIWGGRQFWGGMKN